MPVFRRYPDRPGCYVLSSLRGEHASYALAPEGERYLTLVLGIQEGNEFSPEDLKFLIERRWATLVSPASTETDARTPLPSEQAEPTSSDRPLKAPSASPTKPDGGRPALSRRTRGREVALQVLYLIEQNPEVDPAQIHRFIQRRLHDERLRVFTQGLVEGVRAHQPELDALISSVAENWRIDRMAAIDRNILRLGAFEMLHCPDVPTKVAINEALELAKRYSTAQSSRFVNGILDRLQSASPEIASKGPSTSTVSDSEATPLFESPPEHPDPTGGS